MKGEGIAGAKRAASAFVDALPADVLVGLTTFSDTPRLVAKPTTARPEVKKAIAGLEVRGETALYDGIRLGLKALGKTGERRVVVLSDGADTASKAKLTATVNEVRASGVGIDAVGFKTEESLDAVLNRLARAGGGRLLGSGDEAALNKAFGTAASAFVTRQLAITVQVPEELAGRQVSVRVDVRAGTDKLSDQRLVQMTKIIVPRVDAASGAVRALVPPPVRADTLDNLLVPLAILFAGLAGIVGFMLWGVLRSRSGESKVRKVLELYTVAGKPKVVEHDEATALGETRIAKSAVELAGRVVQKRGMEERLALKIDRAGFALRPSEWLVLQFLASLILTIVVMVLGAKPLLAVIVGFLVGMLGANGYLSVKAGRRRKAFEDALPDSLQLVAGSLQAGYSLPQSLDAVVREGAEPMSSEIGRAMSQSRLGVPMEDALERVGTRMASRDFDWVVMAIRVQREVGGNLSEVLGTVAATIRERARLHRQIRALTAEGRLSALILILLPIGITGLLSLMNPQYLAPLFTTGLGRVMFASAVILVALGTLWMRKLIKVEV
jgi:tight adherence protein B